ADRRPASSPPPFCRRRGARWLRPDCRNPRCAGRAAAAGGRRGWLRKRSRTDSPAGSAEKWSWALLVLAATTAVKRRFVIVRPRLATPSPGAHMDIVFLRGLRVDTVIGVYGWERQIRQTLSLDLELGVDVAAAA